MAFLCLFWGALFKQNDNVKNLKILVVDFDGHVAPYAGTTPFVGPFVIEATDNMTKAGGIMPTYLFKSPEDFNNEPLKVREAVYDMQVWAAVIINANATALLDSAIRQGNASYDPTGACQIIYNTARDQTVASSYIVPSLTALQKRVVSTFGASWILHLQDDFQTLRIIDAPQALSPGIEFTTYDLRPFGPPIATPAVSIGLIYLIIISFFSFTFFLPIHLKYLSPKGHPPLIFHHLIAWRYIATVMSYFFLSLVYSFVSLAFLMPMSNPPASHVWPAKNANAYGRGTFVVYWMGNWVGMTAFGLASENMAMILGTPWTALWLIFWVISNVATGFYALDLAPSFYKWGYAWPMHNSKFAGSFPFLQVKPLTTLQSSSSPAPRFSTFDNPTLGAILASCSLGLRSIRSFSQFAATSCAGTPQGSSATLQRLRQIGTRRWTRRGTSQVSWRGSPRWAVAETAVQDETQSVEMPLKMRYRLQLVEIRHLPHFSSLIW